MPVDEAKALIELINERVRSSGLDANHRDTLIRLIAILEEDLSEGAARKESGGVSNRSSAASSGHTA
jgi:hypothetical protein